jgi:Calcineurin-like phosphoesterase
LNVACIRVSLAVVFTRVTTAMMQPFWYRSALLLGLTAACSRSVPSRQNQTSVEASATAKSAPVAKPQAAPPSQTSEHTFRFPAAERVVAVGDLHGDLASTREALRLAGAIDEQDRWIGGKLVLVQVGDQLDRGDDEPEILVLLERLAQEAVKSGGAVHVLNGNHELMNAVGDLRYVTTDGMRDYANVPVPASAHLPPGFPAEARGRASAFAPGSELARKLAERNTIVIVGDTVFAHAGVLQKHVRYGVGRINDEVRRFLRGESPSLPEIVASDDAPVWTRVYGGPTSDETCDELEAVLTALEVKRMVIGHTVQQTGVTSECGGHVYRVDVGLSDYYGQNRTQVLELTAQGAKVLGIPATTP